jgi:hypothetical protein
MNCLMSAWHRHEAELRARLFEVARNALAERPRLRWDQVELPDEPEVSKAECVAIRRLGKAQRAQFFGHGCWARCALPNLRGAVFAGFVMNASVND